MSWKPTALTEPEQHLVEHVGCGTILDYAREEVDDEKAMRSWGSERTIRATVVREILRGQHVMNPDPHGVRIRGARILGRLNLALIESRISLELEYCLLDEGLDVRDAKLPTLDLTGCRIESTARPALDASGLVADALALNRASIYGNSSAGIVTLLGARLGGLTCPGAHFRNQTSPGLAADGLQVEGNVFFRNGFEAIAAGELGAVRLVGAKIGGRLDCSGAYLHNKSGQGLAADELQVEQAVLLREGFKADAAGELGAVRLVGAKIGSQLDCSGAYLHNKSGPALSADGIQVGRDVFLREEFEALGSGDQGTVRLVGGRIGGQLDCSNACLYNDSGSAFDGRALHVGQALVLRGFEAVSSGNNVTIDLGGMKVADQVVLQPNRLENSSNAEFRLDLDGLVFAGSPESSVDWLSLIKEATPKYAAQPYQHLAAVYQAAGHEAEVRRIAMAQRRDQLDRGALTGRGERAWTRLTGVTLGYGYQPWRALVFLLVVLIAAIVMTLTLGGREGLTRTDQNGLTGVACSIVDRVGVGIEIGLPLINTTSRDRCDIVDNLAGQILVITGWALQLLAWAFATLFVAGFTSAVRKS